MASPNDILWDFSEHADKFHCDFPLDMPADTPSTVCPCIATVPLSRNVQFPVNIHNSIPNPPSSGPLPSPLSSPTSTSYPPSSTSSAPLSSPPLSPSPLALDKHNKKRKAQTKISKTAKIPKASKTPKAHKTKTKPPKTDTNAVKKPKTAYTYYQLSVKDQHWKEVEAQPDANTVTREILSRRVAQLTGKRWKALHPHLKEPFQITAHTARQKYKQRMIEYTERQCDIKIDDESAVPSPLSPVSHAEPAIPPPLSLPVSPVSSEYSDDSSTDSAPDSSPSAEDAYTWEIVHNPFEEDTSTLYNQFMTNLSSPPLPVRCLSNTDNYSGLLMQSNEAHTRVRSLSNTDNYTDLLMQSKELDQWELSSLDFARQQQKGVV